jgi:hypothetical protein
LFKPRLRSKSRSQRTIATYVSAMELISLRQLQCDETLAVLDGERAGPGLAEVRADA